MTNLQAVLSLSSLEIINLSIERSLKELLMMHIDRVRSVIKDRLKQGEKTFSERLSY